MNIKHFLEGYCYRWPFLCLLQKRIAQYLLAALGYTFEGLLLADRRVFRSSFYRLAFSDFSKAAGVYI